MNPRHLERLLEREHRKDPRQTAREHCLPGSRRTGQEQVVTPRRRKLERPPGPLLPMHVREIRIRPVHAGSNRLDWRRLERPPQVGARLREVTDRHRFDPGEGSFGG